MPLHQLLAQIPSDVLGKVEQPVGVAQYNQNSASGIGIILFISNLIKVATVVAGIYVLFNIILAGYIYITAQGDSAAVNKVKDQITLSVIGLVIIVAAYTLIAVISFVLFGDAGYILNPVIRGPLP